MLNKIIDLLNFQKNKNSVILEEKKAQDYDTNAITFILDSKNEPYIHISISDLDKDKAKNFAKLLRDINHGVYITSILDILLNLGKENIDVHRFVKIVLSEWSNLNNEEPTPLVKPTDFMKSLKHE